MRRGLGVLRGSNGSGTLFAGVRIIEPAQLEQVKLSPGPQTKKEVAFCRMLCRAGIERIRGP